jgi:hypothetical protein
MAQHWPGSLISILVLDLTLLAGFFRISFMVILTLLSPALLNGAQHGTFVAQAT